MTEMYQSGELQQLLKAWELQLFID
jgi:hypothetical protein